MNNSGFRQLRVWQKAHQVVMTIYRITSSLPVDERFGLTSPMRRAAVSVAANIAEGYASQGLNRARFFGIAKTSAEELKYYLILVRDMKLLSADSLPEGSVDEVCAMLYRLRENALQGPSSGG